MSARTEKHLPLGIAAVALALVAAFFTAGRDDVSEVKPTPAAIAPGMSVVAVPPPPWLEPNEDDVPTELLASKPALANQIEKFAAAMDTVHGDGGRAEKEMNQVALSLGREEARTLAGWVRDPARAQNFRRASLYLLSRSGSGALPLLAGFLREPVPFTSSPDSFTSLPAGFTSLPDMHAHGDPARGFELSLRVSALEALDRSTDTRSVEKLLQGILLQQNDPSLQFMARVALSGIASGKPHRLGRMIDRMLQERVTQ